MLSYMISYLLYCTYYVYYYIIYVIVLMCTDYSYYVCGPRPRRGSRAGSPPHRRRSWRYINSQLADNNNNNNHNNSNITNSNITTIVLCHVILYYVMFWRYTKIIIACRMTYNFTNYDLGQTLDVLRFIPCQRGELQDCV